jgi:tetratricopeptide (TPR) repeat protein
MNSFESHHALLPLLCDHPIAAYDSCVNSLQRMKEAGYDNANHGRLCRIYMSCAESQLGNPEAARRSFNAILAEMEARPQLGNWYLRLVLDVYHSDALLKVGDVQQARKYCDEFLERVEKTEEWTYRALAYEVSARIALSAGDFGQAEKKITEALAIATNQWIPMARWKIHLTAAEISEVTERVHETLLHLRAAAKGVKALIDPLPNGHSLKESMLQSPAVRKAFLAAEVKNVA